jgi:hypothetical protein
MTPPVRYRTSMQERPSSAIRPRTSARRDKSNSLSEQRFVQSVHEALRHVLSRGLYAEAMTLE